MSNRLANPVPQFLDNSGELLAGGLLYAYVTGTSTPTDTYSDAALTTPNANPVVLDSAGRAGSIFLDPAVTYKLILKTSADVEVWSRDPVVDVAANVTAAFQVYAGDPNGNVAGNAGSVGGSGASAVYDITNDLLYVCTTSGTTSTAVWTQVASSLSGAIVAAGLISPSSLSADQDDWSPTGIASASRVRIATSAAISITGIVAAAASGTRLALENISANNITLLGNNASSSAANRFLFPRPIVIRPSQCVEIEYDLTSTGWRCLSPVTAMPVAGGYKNLVIEVQTDATVDVDCDAITLEDANGEAYRAQSVNLTIDNTASGANGLDTGAVGNDTWYSVWVIYNPTTNTVAGLISTSATAPTMPSGYTFKARVGWVITDGTADFLVTLQKGDRAQYVVGASPATTIEMISGVSGSITTPTWTAVAVGAYVPTTASLIHVVLRTAANSTGDEGAMAAPNNSYGAVSSTTNGPPLGGRGSGTDGTNFPHNLSGTFLLESTNIYYASSDADAFLAVMGWTDNL